VNHRPRARAGFGTTSLRVPWFFFLFLLVFFFLSYRNLTFNPQGVNNEDLSSDQFASSVSGSIVTHAAQILLAAGSIIILIRYRAYEHFHINGKSAWLFLIFACWSLTSVLWAEDLQLTSQRLVGFAILCIAAAAIAHRLSIREIILWTVLSTALFLLLGIVAEVFLGTFQPFASGYRFAGTLGPNDQGVECGMLLLSGAVASDLEERYKPLFWGCAGTGLMFLVLTGSRTALATSLLALLLYEVTVRATKTKIVAGLSTCILSCCLVSLAGFGLLPNLKNAALLGRDDPDSVDSFSGRTAIWQDLETYIEQRPMLGAGYGGFWTPDHIETISALEQHGVPNGHSTYIDYVLTLGVVGLVAYSGLLLTGIWEAFRLYRLSKDPGFAFCGALLSFCMLHGFLESGSAERGFQKFLCMVVLVRLAFFAAKNVTCLPLQPECPASRYPEATFSTGGAI
jgi:exopolysaccharide production protein ExoQ